MNMYSLGEPPLVRDSDGEFKPCDCAGCVAEPSAFIDWFIQQYRQTLQDLARL